jgi:hypothetical protein
MNEFILEADSHDKFALRELFDLLVSVLFMEFLDESIFFGSPISLDESRTQVLIPALAALLARAKNAHPLGNHGPLHVLWVDNGLEVNFDEIFQGFILLEVGKESVCEGQCDCIE